MTGGGVRAKGGHYYARIRIGAAGRREPRLWAATSPESAREITTWIAGLVSSLREAGRLEYARKVVAEAAGVRTARGRASIESLVEDICSGLALPGSPTFGAVAQRWTSGDLARAYPDHVGAKQAQRDASRLARYIFPIAAAIPVAAFGLTDAEKIMAALPPMSRSNRRHIAQIVSRVLALAVFPLRLIPSSPIPAHWLPKVSERKAKAFLYPDEDAALLACEAIPMAERLLFGVLVREGARVSEIASAEWWQFDRQRGFFSCDANKTGDPRVWAMRPDVVRALAAWRKITIRHERPFAGVSIDRLGVTLRKRLAQAGVARAELFTTTDVRQRIRAHDLRATFVTLALAGGKTETWVSDRTGHRSSEMIHRYRRQARSVAERGISYDQLVPLDAALGLVNDAAPTPTEPAGPPDGSAFSGPPGAVGIPGTSPAARAPLMVIAATALALVHDQVRRVETEGD